MGIDILYVWGNAYSTKCYKTKTVNKVRMEAMVKNVKADWMKVKV